MTDPTLPASSTNLEALLTLGFGDDIAEHDAGLAEYFVPTSAYWSVLTDEADLVLGPKGSGKSAIARYLCNPQVAIDELGDVDILPAFNVQGSLLFKKLGDAGLSRGEHDHRNVFFAYMVSLIANHLIRSYPDHTEELKRLLDDQGLYVQIPVHRNIFQRALERFNPRIEAGVKIDAMGQPEIVGRATLVPREEMTSDRALELESLAETCVAVLTSLGRRCWIVFDRLDEAFPEDRALEKAALRGLLRAHLDLVTFGTAVRPKLFLRSDLLSRITEDEGFTNFSHLRAHRIRWDSPTLLSMLARRIRASGVLNAMDAIYPSNLGDRQICRAILPGALDRMRRMDSVVWLLLVTRDASREINPRNVLTLLRAARTHAIGEARIDPKPPSRTTGLLPARSLDHGYNHVSVARLEDTVLAEGGRWMRQLVEGLRGREIQFTHARLAEKLGLSGPTLDRAVAELKEVGVIRLYEGDLLVATLYRPALFADNHVAEVDAIVHAPDIIIDSPRESADSAPKKRLRKRRGQAFRDNLLSTRPVDDFGEADLRDTLIEEVGILEAAGPTSDSAPVVRVEPRQERETRPRFSAPEIRAMAAEGRHAEAIATLLPDHENLATALCLAADVAYDSRSIDLISRVNAALDNPRLAREGSVQGRKFALGVLHGDLEETLRESRSISMSQLSLAAIGIVRMCGQDVNRERWVYRAVADYVTDSGTTWSSHGRLVGALPVLDASRVLAFARWSAVDNPKVWEAEREAAVADYWNAYPPSVVRAMHGIAFAYTRNPEEPVPTLLPYQILSVAAVLEGAEALPKTLETALTGALAKAYESLVDTHRVAFDAWAAYSTMARRAIEDAGPASSVGSPSA